MKKQILAALMAAVSIVPGIAFAQDGQRDRSDRQPRREQAADRDRPAPQRRVDAPQRPQAQRADRPNRDMRGDNGPQRAERNRPVVQQDRRNDGRPDYRQDRRVGDQRRYANGNRGYDNRRNDNGRYQNSRNWNRTWRNDNRYNWNRYRSYNRGAFNLPRYYAPYGWNNGYRRFSVGFRLSSVLFGQNYWISDPWDYRLPPAYGAYRWVRYYNDALLVDVRSGQVVDTVYGIFW